MTKQLFQISIFAIFLYGCGFEIPRTPEEKQDLEMDVINDLLTDLIPKNSPCMPASVEGETSEEYNLRLESFYREVDSVGKKVEIVNALTKLDSNYIEAYKGVDKSQYVDHILNAPNVDRIIDSTMLKDIKNIKTILISEPRKTEGTGLTDCYTLGQVNISRVGFNKDSTRAAFKYFVDNGSCFIEYGGVINAEFRDGKWQIVK